jgi:aspartate carbamoyltransferase catalytic subunit
VDLLSIDSLTDAQIRGILDRAQLLFEDDRSASKPVETLAGRIVFNLFYENSTRTAMSFATAAHRLGASALSLSVEHSSMKKGETLEDTAATLGAMRPDALVIRHRENGAPAKVAAISATAALPARMPSSCRGWARRSGSPARRS